MPSIWSPKDERQYGHILASCRKRGRYGVKRCKSLAAATVNKTRNREGRTLGALAGIATGVPIAFAAMGGVFLLSMLSAAQQAKAQLP